MSNTPAVSLRYTSSQRAPSVLIELSIGTAKLLSEGHANITNELMSDIRKAIKHAEGALPASAPEKQRTDREIVAETNELARQLASLAGWSAPEGHPFHEMRNERERLLWEQACAAQELLTLTSPSDSLSELDYA